MMTIDELFERLPRALNRDAADGVDATIQFNGSEPRHIVIRDGELVVHGGVAERYTVGVTLSDDDFVALLNGELDGMSAFMTGRLKLDGDIMFAQRIGSLFNGAALRDTANTEVSEDRDR